VDRASKPDRRAKLPERGGRSRPPGPDAKPRGQGTRPRSPDRSRRFLVTSAPGHEALLAEELSALGLKPVLEPSGAVVLMGGWAEAARVLVRSRIASRVFLSLRRVSCRTRAMLYDQVRRVDWPTIFPTERTFSVQAHGSTEGTDFAISYAPLRIKDAIVDEFRKKGFLRPNVDRHDPDVRLRAYFFRGRCELSIDLAGRALHRRGYRADGAEAPLRENRAAALLLFSGYDGSRPFLDPFCGSGTIAIEAALIATRTAPGLLRRVDEFALGALFPEAAGVLGEEYARARKERLPRPPHPIRGSDLVKSTLETARANAGRAGVSDWVTFTRQDAREIDAPDSWIVTNPPYGERLEDPIAAAELIKAFTHRVKHHAVGARLGLVLPRGALENAVGLRPEKKLAVESGPLQLRYLTYAIRAGRFTPGSKD
jgi:putative N6-adenine-specific DNA methylase